MAIIPSKIEVEEVSNILLEELNVYHSSIKERLGIHDVTYSTEVGTFKVCNGYPDEHTLASSVPNSEGTGVEKIIFFSASITDKINRYYSKIYNKQPAFMEAAKILIRFAIIHELVHIKQFKNGLTFEQYKQIDYTENPWEREANEVASEIISETGSFGTEIINVLREITVISSEKLDYIIGLFDDNENN
jgi:hypothetical protein